MIAHFRVKQCPYCHDEDTRRSAVCFDCQDKWTAGYSPCDTCQRLCAPFTRDNEQRCERCHNRATFFQMLADARWEKAMAKISGRPYHPQRKVA